MQDALARYEITYPVAIDNDRLTWGAYNQRYWPTTYLIDKEGNRENYYNQADSGNGA